MGPGGTRRDTRSRKPPHIATSDAIGTLPVMASTVSIPATRSNDPTGHEAARGAGSDDSGERRGVSRSTPLSTPQRVDGDYTHPPRSLLVVALLIVFGLAFDALADTARAATWRTTTATWYGPGLYGNAFACSHRSDVPNSYGRQVRGIAHMTLPCGERVTVCRRARCVKVLVIDRGAFHAANLDLTARTAMDLCRCWRPYTQTVRWRRGWAA